MRHLSELTFFCQKETRANGPADSQKEFPLPPGGSFDMPPEEGNLKNIGSMATGARFCPRPMKIHPTALVSPHAQLGTHVEVGPFAIIEDHVTLGDDCVVQAHAILTNHVTLGDRNRIGYGTVIGAAPQDLAHNDSIISRVEIGNDNVFREYVTIHRGSKEASVTRVGHHNLLMTGAHLGHNCQIGDRNIIANNCLLAGYVTLGDDAVLGGGSVYHQNLRVGNMVMIRGGTAWSADIPPYTIGLVINTLVGLNSVGMRRKGISAEARKDVRRAYELVYRSGLNITQALAESESGEWAREARQFLDFIRTRSKRGICRARQSGAETAESGE